MMLPTQCETFKTNEEIDFNNGTVFLQTMHCCSMVCETVCKICVKVGVFTAIQEIFHMGLIVKYCGKFHAKRETCFP